MSAGSVPAISEDLFVLALGIACLLWGFAGTRFTRIVLVCARRVAGYAAIAGMLYMGGLSGDLRRAAELAARLDAGTATHAPRYEGADT